MHQAYIGAGWEPVKGLAVGANFSYLWGSIDRSVANSYSNSYYKTLTRYYSMQVNSYKVDFGVQYTHQFSKKDWATVGVTFSPGHGLGASADMKIISNDTQNGVTDTTAYSIGKAYKLPTMIGAGVMWNHNNQWKVGFDYSLQKWGSLGYPSFDGTNYALKMVSTRIEASSISVPSIAMESAAVLSSSVFSIV